MCLVELENSVKPVISCATIVTKGIKVYTNSVMVQKVRESILEFLLLNHPLDCPICDQGGECDLQDQNNFYGLDKSRAFKKKRSVSDKVFNPLVSGIMSRCIHCSRCVRFSTEVSKPIIGFLGRGQRLEVSTFFKNIFKSEFSGNVIDLCPVGALTSNSFKFKGRPWELNSVVSFDFFDIFGLPLVINFKNKEIFRVLPFSSLETNFNWISDRSRFSYDSYKMQRLAFPMVKIKNQFLKKTWKKIFKIFSKIELKKKNILGIIGENTDLETIFFFKKFLNFLGSSNILLETSLKSKNFKQDFRNGFLFNFLLVNKIDFFLIVNLNLRIESTNFNLQIKNFFYNNFNHIVYNIGSSLNLNYPVKQLGYHLGLFFNILEGKHKISKKIKKLNKSLILLNPEINLDIQNLNIKFLYLHFFEINSFEVGIKTRVSKKAFFDNSSFLFLLNSNLIKIKKYSKNKSLIFLGFQGGFNVLQSNLVLPGVALIEKKCSMVTGFGSKLVLKKVLSNYLKSKEDFKILQILIFFYSKKNYISMSKELPFSKNFNFFPKLILNLKKKFNCFFIESRIKSYFLFSHFTKMSLTMRKYSKFFKITKNSYKKLKKKN